MGVHPLRGVLISVLLAGQVWAQPASGPATQPALRPAPDLPPTSPEDLVLLVRNTRSAIKDKLTRRPERAARYCPPALKHQTVTLHATLRRDGASVAEAELKPMNVVEAAQAAGAMIGGSLLEKKLQIDIDACGLELEWFSTTEPISALNDEQGKWSDALLHSFEPGIEGVGVEFRGRKGWTRPSQVIALNYTPDVALQAAEKAAEVSQMDKLRATAEVKYFRFRTRHVWQADGRATPLVLTRGTSVVELADVDERGLDAAIVRSGSYLRYRQNTDGWYSEEYLPTPDRYTAGNSASVQMRALRGLARFAEWTGDPAIVAAAIKGAARSAIFLVPLQLPQTSQPTSSPAASMPSASVGRMLVFPGHSDYLRVSADFYEALRSLPRSPEFDSSCRDLIAAFRALQNAEGRIAPPQAADQPGTTDDVSSAALAWTSLAEAEQSKSDALVEQALRRAEHYYQDWYKHSAEPRGAAAVARALCLTYVITNDARTSDPAFSILDRFVGLQLGPSSTAWPDLNGAISTTEPGVLGVDTADYLLALCDGLELARRIGDSQRITRYRDAVRNAVRFVVQLEFREAGAYYVRSRRDALGGTRKSPWNNEIRADYCSDALLSLIAARTALFGPRSPSK